MKALKTIVATAVIVFALTTVATAGVRHLGDHDGDTQHPAYAQTAAQTAAGVTLSSEQFAALLKAAGDDGSAHHAKHATRTHEKAQKHSRTHASEADHDAADAQHSDGQQQGSGVATHHAETAAVHDGGSQDHGTHDAGTHDAGTHDGGSHDGGCD
jgi:hypothetical protein